MTCRQARQLIHEVLDARMDRWPAEIDEHIGACQGCRQAAEQLRHVSALAAKQEVSAPTDRYFAAAAKRAVLAHRAPKAAPGLSLSLVGMAAGVFALCILSFALGRVYFPKTQARSVGVTIEAAPEGRTPPGMITVADPMVAPMATALDTFGEREELDELPTIEPIPVSEPLDMGTMRTPRRALRPSPPIMPAATHAARPAAPMLEIPAEVGIELGGQHHRITIRRIDAGTELGPIDPSILNGFLLDAPAAPALDHRTQSGATRGV